MKRNYSAVLSLLLAGGICCTGCAKAGGEATAAQKPGGSFTTEMTMTMEDWTAAGTLSRLGDGAWSVSFAEPATLAGVVLDFSGGEVTASYKGLGFSVPQSAMPAKSVLNQMIQVVDELALDAALKADQFRYAVLDVQSQEPPKEDYPLYQNEKVILTPHMASNTEECMGRMALHAAMQIHKVLSGEKPDWPVNHPQL